MERIYQSEYKYYVQQKQYLNHLISGSFQGANILLMLSFENKAGRAGHIGYYL